ncbi:MAG TPA: competence/damage-inducible protein A, partial [Kofleriaceae bacterium]|nr:competence/damage-inducible protein A [Kofleriaceae bacterium]
MRAEILTIGDELCRGEIIDTNSSYLAARLWDLDITTRWMTSCNDHEADIVTALSQAVSRSDLVVCSGGLGPTEDDLTVDVVARLGGVDVVIDEAARRRMEERFAGRLEITPIQLRQVRVPAGARVHGNPAGLAPCFELPIDGVPVICLPGFPREIQGIVEQSLTRRWAELREGHGAVERIARRIYRVFGRGESLVSQA